MPVVSVNAPNSIQKQVLYNINQQLIAKTQGSIPGLEDELKEYPKSIVSLIRKMLQADSGFGFTGLETTNNTSQISTFKGYIVDSDLNIYYIEPLTLTPTGESHWGFYELELVQDTSDEVTLAFVNPSTVPKQFFTQAANTKKRFRVNVYENYNTTASFPTLTPGRIRWIDYKKTAAFGTISEVTNNLRNLNLLESDVVNTNNSTETKKPLSADQGRVLNTRINKVTVKGFATGILGVGSSASIVRIPKGNVFEVKNQYVTIENTVDLNFSSLTNIFRNDGVTPIAAASELINKHIYLLLSDTGGVSAMIVPDPDMPSSSHAYGVNPKLLSDYYSTTPTIWNPDENGYYEGTKRIIATLRIGASNVVDFWYSLGFGYRFFDVQSLPIGGQYNETRWKREHPNCYVPDGSTVSSMSTEAPALHRILGGNILPDWRNRFPRSIDIAGARLLLNSTNATINTEATGNTADKHLQADAFQGHRHNPLSPQISFYGGLLGAPAGAASGVNYGFASTTGDAVTDGTNGTPKIANETRGSNFAVSIQIVRG